MFDALLSTMRVIALPTKTNFRGISKREVALFQGEKGWGEFSPFLEYGDGESSKWLASAVEAATEERPRLFRSAIPVNGTIPATNDKALIEKLVESYPGVTTYKVKVGENLAEDLARLAFLQSINPSFVLRIDVNGSWSVEEALFNLNEIYNQCGAIQYVEQPVGTIEEMRELKSKLSVPLPIAADEVIRKAQDPFSINLADAADIVMLKVQPLGGINRSIEIAKHHQLPVVVSSALESAVGIHYGLQLAAALPKLTFDCGLATGSLLARDVAELPIRDGLIHIDKLDINPDGLDVDVNRYQWWKNRAMRCAEILELS